MLPFSFQPGRSCFVALLNFKAGHPTEFLKYQKEKYFFFYWQSLFFMCIVVSIIFIRNIYLTFLKIKSGLTGGAERKLRGKEQIIAPHFAFPLRPILVMRYKPLDPKIGPTNGNKQHIFFLLFFFICMKASSEKLTGLLYDYLYYGRTNSYIIQLHLVGHCNLYDVSRMSILKRLN